MPLRANPYFVPVTRSSPYDRPQGRIVPSSPNLASRFTEFYCQANGSNLNAGSTTDAAAVYTSTNGNWDSTTRIFTPTDGTNPVAAGVQSGMFVSVYVDGATVGVFIARIASVSNAANGPIILSTSVNYGTAPSTSATARTIKVGGAWLGPNGTSNFPFAFAAGTLGGLINANSDCVRINFKNDQAFTVTAQLVFTTGNNAILQGYTSSPGDGGKATFTSNVTAAANFATAPTNGNNTFIDLIFVNTGASNAFDCFLVSGGNSHVFFRCVFRGARASGFNNNSTTLAFLFLCEAYNNNASSSSASAGIKSASGANTICWRAYSHDNIGGANGNGFYGAGHLTMIECISANNSGNGTQMLASSGSVCFMSLGCSYYKNIGDAIKHNSSTVGEFNVLLNNAFVQNGGSAVNVSTTSQSGILLNNARANNKTGDLLKSIINTGTDFMLPDGVTPWNAPDTGDFSTVLAQAIGSGFGQFTETDGTNTGTVGYPDIGAAQAQPVTQSWTVTGTQTLPDGFIGHLYGWKWFFSQNATITVQSGSIPPGLNLSQPTSQSVYINGTPTAIGIYDFVLRATVGGSTGDSPFRIEIKADPDEGIGGLLGGLRPTC